MIRLRSLLCRTRTEQDISLKSLRGKVVVLYFYPRADTPGCTIEACEFRDTYKQMQKTGAVLLGISPDTPQAQKKFQEKFKLPFSLLADADKKVADRFRRAEREEHVREEGDGHRPDHVHHRTGRQNPAHLSQSEGGRPCRERCWLI